MAAGLKGLRFSQMAEERADAVSGEVVNWSPVPRDTLGRQLVDAADSAGGNIGTLARKAKDGSNKASAAQRPRG